MPVAAAVSGAAATCRVEVADAVDAFTGETPAIAQPSKGAQ